MRLNGKVTIVTGGGSGIGKATALKMAAEGAKLVVADVNLNNAEEVAATINGSGGEAISLKVNVSKYEEVEQMIEKTVQHFGTVHVVFNNAGIGASKPFLQHNPEEDYDRVISINQNGVYYGILCAAKKMVELGVHGTIINTASVYGIMAAENTFSYNATKAAVIMMTKSAALELGRHHIRVVAVAPGRVNTPIFNSISEKNPELWDHIKKEQMRGSLTEPEEIANVVAFLASNEASAINGTVIGIEDGYTSYKFPLPLN